MDWGTVSPLDHLARPLVSGRMPQLVRVCVRVDGTAAEAHSFFFLITCGLPHHTIPLFRKKACVRAWPPSLACLLSGTSSSFSCLTPLSRASAFDMLRARGSAFCLNLADFMYASSFSSSG